MGEPDPLDIFLADYARADAREKAAKAEKDEARKLIAKEIAERPSGKYVGDLGSVTQGKDKTETVTVFDEARFKEKAPKTWEKYVERKGKDHEGATHHHPREERKRSGMSNDIEHPQPVHCSRDERERTAALRIRTRRREHDPEGIPEVTGEHLRRHRVRQCPRQSHRIVALNEINVIERHTVAVGVHDVLAGPFGRAPGAHSEHGGRGRGVRDHPRRRSRVHAPLHLGSKKAQDAGLWGKGHWAKDPATMLRWRAISECVRMACPEVLGGLVHDRGTFEFTGSPAPSDRPHLSSSRRRTSMPCSKGASPAIDLNTDREDQRRRLNEFRGALQRVLEDPRAHRAAGRGSR